MIQFDQGKLRTTLKNLGYYSDKDDFKGICWGFSVAAMNACYSGELKKFEDRLQYMNDHPDLAGEVANINIKSIQDKIKNHVALTDQETKDKESYDKYIDVKAFCESMVSPQKRPYAIYGEYIFQENEKFFPLVQSKAMEEKGGLVIIDNTVNVYTPMGLTDYFKKLSESFNHNEDIVLRITSSQQHTIDVFFDSEKGFCHIIDANLGVYGCHLNNKGLDTNSAEWLAKEICNDAYYMGHAAPIGSNDQFMLNIMVAAPQDKKSQIESIYNDFKETDAYKNAELITPEKAHFLDVGKKNQISLAMFAVQHDCAKEVKELHKLGINLNNQTYLIDAAELNATNAARALHEEGANLNARFLKDMTVIGSTMAHIAARQNNVDMLRVLDECHVNLNKICLDISLLDIGKKPIDMAKEKIPTYKNDSAVQFILSVNHRDKLLKKCDDLEKRLHAGEKETINTLKKDIIDDWKNHDKNNQHAIFNKEDGWKGEIERTKTEIVVARKEKIEEKVKEKNKPDCAKDSNIEAEAMVKDTPRKTL